MKANKHHVLYVDDEEHNLISFKAAFRPYYHIHIANSAREGIRVLKEHPIDIVITDQRMPEMTGVQFLEAIIPDFPDTIRMILTGFSDVEAIIKAINSGRVYRYITKPWDENHLKMTIDAACTYYRLQEQNRKLLSDLQETISEQERIMTLFKKYVPEYVVNDALAATEDRSMFEGEGRILSVLFADIRNFSQITHRLDPRDVVALLNEYFTLMTECVKAHKGTVNKFIGDGIMALFGAPVSYIDNQDNAVACALEMRERLSGFNDRHAERIGMRFDIGIGINTGEVVVGNIGSDDRVEYTAIGDTVNVASRIESATKQKPNSILISESTHRSLDDTFETVRWDPIEVKGKQDPIVVFEVVGRK